ncbi:MAG TPA: hypothetical protein VFO19_05570 [Vicinamibacterales bacterium]|jgi:tetratricopeptide (TPR) repeat protein|nr:hypothetical protein [Vicinamibacterales bacterium]
MSASVREAEIGVALEPRCATCLGTLAFFLFYHDWQFDAAEARFDEALRIDPTLEGVRPSYAMLLAVTGRPARAVAEVDIGLARQPYRLSWLIIRASALYFDRRYEEAVATADRALAISNTNAGAWEWRSRALFLLGRGDDAVMSVVQTLPPDEAPRIDRALREGGVDDALRMLLSLTDNLRGRVEHAWRRATWRALLGDTEGALDELERACEYRRFNAINLGADPAFDALRLHPRYRALLDRMRLSPYFQPPPALPVTRPRER